MLAFALVALYGNLSRLYVHFLSNGGSYFRAFFNFMIFIHVCSSLVMDEQLYRRWRFQTRSQAYVWYDVTNMANLKILGVALSQVASVVWMAFMSASYARTESTTTATQTDPNFAIKEKFRFYITVELVIAVVIAFRMGTFTIPVALISIFHDASLLIRYFNFVSEPTDRFITSLWISIVLHVVWFATLDFGIWWALSATSELFQRSYKNLFFLVPLTELAYLVMMYNMTSEF